MEVRTIFRERTILCGFSAQGDAGRRIIDLHLDDFYIRQRPAVNKISRRKNQYYGVFWWTEDNHRFHYFLGQDIGALRLIPRQMEIKILPRGLYAAALLGRDYDLAEAWSDFYYAGLAGAGCRPRKNRDVNFEYYPETPEEEVQLWTLVEKLAGNEPPERPDKLLY